METATLDDLKKWRRHIHSNPELSLKEFQTSEYIRKELTSLSEDGLLNINVLAVFQPSEESFGGADMLSGKYDFKKYNVEAAYALHVNPDYP